MPGSVDDEVDEGLTADDDATPPVWDPVRHR
jgi:hypothetical protein